MTHGSKTAQRSQLWSATFLQSQLTGRSEGTIRAQELKPAWTTEMDPSVDDGVEDTEDKRNGIPLEAT